MHTTLAAGRKRGKDSWLYNAPKAETQELHRHLRFMKERLKKATPEERNDLNRFHHQKMTALHQRLAERHANNSSLKAFHLGRAEYHLANAKKHWLGGTFTMLTLSAKDQSKNYELMNLERELHELIEKYSHEKDIPTIDIKRCFQKVTNDIRTKD